MLQTLSATSGRMVTWLAAGIIIISLAGLWLFSGRVPSTQKKRDQKLAKTVFRQKMPQNRIMVNTVGNKTVLTVKIPDNPAPANKSQPAPAAAPPIEPQAQVKIDQIKKEKAVTAEHLPESQAPIESDPAEKEKTVAAELPTKTQSPIRIDPAEKEKTVAPEKVMTASLKKDSPPEIIPQQEAKPAPVVVKSAAQEIRREKWLLSRDGRAYTVQVIGVSKEKYLLDFIQRNPVLKQNEIAYFESTFRGKPWFQLLYGIYPDKQAARLAANKLPENTRHAGPWIRSIAAVQKEIANKF